jgi:hypothetical protein
MLDNMRTVPQKLCVQIAKPKKLTRGMPVGRITLGLSSSFSTLPSLLFDIVARSTIRARPKSQIYITKQRNDLRFCDSCIV